jgi:ATP-GRASP peptide maturase of grasp-with-spasm system
MILILSEKVEKSTDEVIEYFNYWQIPYKRINLQNGYNIVRELTINQGKIDIVFRIDDADINLSDIVAVWFRRGHLYFYSWFDFRTIEGKNLKKEVIKHLENEDVTLLHFIYQQLKTKKSLNVPLVYNMNKLIGLSKAIDAGLKVPNTLVTNKKEILNDFTNNQGQVITKNIQDVLSVNMGHYAIGHTTRLLDIEHNTDLKGDFYYSLFQKNIPKKYELRVFYLDGECYTAVIFSQCDERTKVDYRHYDDFKMNRIVPYKLPKSEAMKIDIFMKSIEMESGSIDIIVDTEDNYIFLEVNPVGQFDYVGKNCNYQLEKVIAEYFIQN